MLDDRVLAAARRRDVHELERPGGERVHRVSAYGRRHNHCVTNDGRRPRSSNVGSCWRFSHPGTDDETELAEVEELVRAAGVEPVGSVVQHRARPARAHVRRQGKDRGAEAGVRAARRGVADRRRRARAGAAALSRGRAPGARRRPDAADPRHLRPARRQRRGEAPGRARAARVQPAAHARRCGSTSSASAAAAGRSAPVSERAGRASRSSRPTAGWRGDASPSSSGGWPRCRGSARRAVRNAPGPRSRRSRSPATRTRASRRS